MNHPEHARTGTSAVGRWIRSRPSLRRGDGGSSTPAQAELGVVDMVAQHNEQPYEQLPRDRDFGFGPPASMHQGEVRPPEVAVHAGRMRRRLTEREAEEGTALFGDRAEMIFVGGGIDPGAAPWAGGARG